MPFSHDRDTWLEECAQFMRARLRHIITMIIEKFYKNNNNDRLAFRQSCVCVCVVKVFAQEAGED